MQAGPERAARSESGSGTADRRGVQSPRLCLIVSESGADATALQSAVAVVAPRVRIAHPTEVGGQLWRAAGPRVLIACGAEGVSATVPWLPLLQSAANTATLALLDAARSEIVAVLERFDAWLPARTPPAVVAQQVMALWGLMERQARLNSPQQITGHNLVIDISREEALDANDRRLPLTPSEFRLLAAMALQPGRVVDFWQLGAALPGHFRNADDAYNSVKVHIGRLRQKLIKSTGWDGHLVSVRGRGFLFERRTPREPTETDYGGEEESTMEPDDLDGLPPAEPPS